MPKLNETQQEARRTRILDAAEACFARNGFHRTTMQDICREAGISAGALYVYFNSKEALIEGFSARERGMVLEAFGQLADAPDFMQALAGVVQDVIVGRPRHKSVIWLELATEATRNPAIFKTQQACQAQIEEALTSLLERAKEAGRIAPAVPVPEIVAAMEVMAEGLFCRRAADENFDAAAVGATLLTLMSSLIRPVSPRSSLPAGLTPVVPESA